jgi:hypothetical protein
MATPEGKVKKEVKKILERYKIYYFMPVKHPLYSKAGIADFICCVNSKFLAIETKGPDGKESELQEEDSKSVRESKGLKLIIKMEDLEYFETTLLRILGRF